MKRFTLALLFSISLLTPAFAQSLTDAQKKEVETIVREYLVKNPEVLREMAAALEAKDKLAEESKRAEGLAANADAIFRLAGDATGGNPKGNVTIVEFMDYNCGWCKRSVDELTQLMAQDKEVRVVFKEFPIFGAASEYAARAALAAAKQNKYWEMHQALFKQEGQVSEEVVDKVAAEIGLDVPKMKTDMMSKDVLETITKNQELGKALAINGTPAFIIDDIIEPGYLPVSGLTERIAAVRAEGCKFC